MMGLGWGRGRRGGGVDGVLGVMNENGRRCGFCVYEVAPDSEVKRG